MRVNQWAVKLFTAIVAYRHYKPNEKLQFRDQSAMDKVMKEPMFVQNIVQAPQRWFNAYQGEHNETLAPFQIRRGDLLVHFAGVPQREERMGFWLDRAEEHLDDWEVPLKSTSYPQERKDFWDELSRGRQGQKEEMAEARLKATQLLSLNEAQLEEYGERLSVGDREAINLQRAALGRVMGDQELRDDLARLNEEVGKLEETAKPLALAVKNSHKVLLNAAHDAIFAGEKDLLDANYIADPANPDLQAIENAIARLKQLVMAPQSEWKKPTITAATNQLTEARAKVKDKLYESFEAAPELKASSLNPSNNKKHVEAANTADGRGKDEGIPPPQTAVEAVAQEPAVVTITGEAVIKTVTQDAAVDGHADAFVVTSTGPATTVVHVQTVVGEPVIATVTGEAVAVTVTQEAVPVTLWTVVEEEVSGATAVALLLPEGPVEGDKGEEGHKEG